MTRPGAPCYSKQVKIATLFEVSHRPLLFFCWSRRVCDRSLTKNSQALGENWSSTGFTFAFICSISTFILRELTKSGASCGRQPNQLSKTLWIHVHVRQALCDHSRRSFCSPEHRRESLHTEASRIFSRYLSESARCFSRRGPSRPLVSLASQRPRSKWRIYLKQINVSQVVLPWTWNCTKPKLKKTYL